MIPKAVNSKPAGDFQGACEVLPHVSDVPSTAVKPLQNGESLDFFYYWTDVCADAYRVAVTVRQLCGRV